MKNKYPTDIEMGQPPIVKEFQKNIIQPFLEKLIILMEKQIKEK